MTPEKIIEKREEMREDLIYRLRKRAEIRRQIPTRKSVQEGQADRIADLLEEAADALENARKAYHLKYDAFFYKDTGEWIESECGDPTCEYCMNRPENAYE